MEGLLGVFKEMVTLFAIVGVGYFIKRIGFMTEAFDKALSKLVLTITLPSMIVASVLTAKELPPLQDIISTFLISCCSYALVVCIAYAVTFLMRIHPGNRGVFKFMMCFGNVGFIGFPVLSAIYGSGSLIYATVFILPFNLTVFTIGAWFLTQDNDEGSEVKATWRTILSPANIACVIAIVLALFGVHSVPVLGDTINTLGSMTTPAALIIVGSSLANMAPSQLLGGPRLWIASLTRLAIVPLITWAVFHFFVTDPILLGVIVVISGMPVATNGTMLCYQYGGNAKTMAQGTFITTVFSLISIPLLTQFLTMF